MPPLTRDQVRLLKRDNVVTPGALTFADLGIQAEGLDAILPTYLDRYRPGGRLRPARPRSLASPAKARHRRDREERRRTARGRSRTA